MHIFISTGEVSGDLQGALLIQALKKQAEQQGLPLEITALGGEKMATAGCTLLGDTTGIGSMGLLESLPFVVPTWLVQQRAKQYLQEHPPDILVLIDYLGPNVAIGNYLRRHLPTIPRVYYITPQAWVWSPSQKNSNQIMAIADRLLAIFPEEARYFRERGANVSWVGHPLVDRLQNAPTREDSRIALGIPEEQIAITLLPASRQQELKFLLPVICQAAKVIQEKLPEAHFWLPLSRNDFQEKIEEAIATYGLRGTIVKGKTLEAIAAADLAITKSGTVNLEIALLNVPQVVLYRLHPLTMWVARNILNFSIPFMSPTNLVLMKSIVPELFQEEATPERIVQEGLDLLLNQERRKETLLAYEEMRRGLGEVGVCDRAAQEILSLAT